MPQLEQDPRLPFEVDYPLITPPRVQRARTLVTFYNSPTSLSITTSRSEHHPLLIPSPS